MAKARQSEDAAPDTKSKGSFRSALTKSYAGEFKNPLTQRVQEHGQQHVQAILNLGELATVGIGAIATAEINHTRASNQVWGWRMAEFLSSIPVLIYTKQSTVLGRIALGVFLGAAVETLVDSTPGVTGWASMPPTDSIIRISRKGE